jgi:hypothetical protein
MWEEIAKLNQVLHLLEGTRLKKAKRQDRQKHLDAKYQRLAGEGLLLPSGHAGRRSEQGRNSAF